MKSKLDTLAITTASGVAGGAVAYGAAVKSLGFLSFALWKLGVPMVAIFSGPVIIGAVAATAVVGGGVYCIAKGIVSQRAKQEQFD